MGDRLRKARAEIGLTTREFAADLGVSQGTVVGAEGDKRAVRQITINAWAMRTGVPREWLETGIAPRPEPEGEGVRQEGVEPSTR